METKDFCTVFLGAVEDARGRDLSNGRLSPVRLAQLRASGLNGKTVLSTGLVTIPAEAAEDYLGYSPGSDCLVFEYPTADGTRYFRLKPERAYRDFAGHARKYLARTGTGNRLYVPPSIRPDALADVDKPLIICEGEEKALKACQEGFLAVAVSGVDSWRTGDPNDPSHSRPIPDLDAITESGRTVYILYVGDVPDSRKVWRAAEQLALELRGRGGRGLVAKLPVLDGEKSGLDDFLTKRGNEALQPVLETAVPPTTVFFQHHTFVPLRLAREFKAQAVYVYARDPATGGGQLYGYWQGVYRPAGDVGERAQQLLQEETRKCRIEEAVAALKNEVAIDIDELNPRKDLM